MSGPDAGAGRMTSERETRVVGRTALVGLLVVQAFIGYEWLMSGLTKILRGGFVSGLAGELRDKSGDAPSWYKDFLHGTVIPNAKFFGVVIEVGEFVGGAALIVGAIVWLARWDRLNLRGKKALLIVIAAASAIGIFMNVNFHLANGGTHVWLMPRSGFDEGVDLDSLMPMLELVLVAVSVRLLVALRPASRRATSPTERPAAGRMT